jgi:hypothetical protein
VKTKTGMSLLSDMPSEIEGQGGLAHAGSGSQNYQDRPGTQETNLSQVGDILPAIPGCLPFSNICSITCCF